MVTQSANAPTAARDKRIDSRDAALEQSLSGEYAIIKHDLIKVVLINVIFMVAIVGLYYYDKNSGGELQQTIVRLLGL